MPRADPLVLEFSLAYHEPFAWDALLDFLGPRAIPGVESVDRTSHPGGVYRRTFRVRPAGSRERLEQRDGPQASEPSAVCGWLSVHRDPEARALRVVVEPASTTDATPAPDRLGARDGGLQAALAGRLGEVFDLAAESAEIDRVLSGAARLADHVARVPGVRVPGAFDRFETAVRAILGQQISVKGATTLAGRIASRWGETLPGGHAPATSPAAPARRGPQLDHVFPSASALAEAPLEEVGLTRARANTIRGLARAVLESPDLLRPPGGLDEAIERWQSLSGIGPWTAQYVAMRVLRASDALPVGDLGLRKAVSKSASKPGSAGEVEKALEGCRPYRAYATMRLWALLGEA